MDVGDVIPQKLEALLVVLKALVHHIAGVEDQADVGGVEALQCTVSGAGAGDEGVHVDLQHGLDARFGGQRVDGLQVLAQAGEQHGIGGVRLGRVVGHEAHPHLTAADAAGGVEHARQGLQLIGGKVGRQAEDLQPGLVAQGLGLCRLGLDAAQLQRAFVAGPVAQGKGDVFRLFLRHFGHAPLHAVVAQLLQQADGLLDAVFRHAHGKNAEFHKYTPFSDDAARGFADRLLHFKYTRLRAGGKTHFLRS